MNKTRLFLKQLKSIGFVDKGACEGADIIAAKSADEGGNMENVGGELQRLSAMVESLQSAISGLVAMAQPAAEPEPEVVEAAAEAVVPDEDDTAEKADITKRLEDLEKRAVAAEEVAKAERDKRLTAEWVTKAREELASLPAEAEQLGCVLKRASESLSADDFAELSRVLKAAAAQIAANDAITAEVGKAGNEGTETAEKRIDGLVKGLLSEGVAKTYGEAIAVLGGRAEHRSLFEAYRNETLRRGA